MTKDLDLLKLHKSAMPIYKKASDLALAYFNKRSLSYDVKNQNGLRSVVTAADRDINELLAKSLTKLLPEATVYSEEGDRTMSEKYTWIIDPIDGTTNFHAGIDFWGIAISLREHGKTVYAAILYPTLIGKMFFGFSGLGTFTFDGKKIKAENSRSFKMKFSVDGPVPQLREMVAKIDFGKPPSLMRMGSFIVDAYCILRGGLDFALGFNLDIYDIDAASLLAQGAGYKVKLFNDPDKDGYCRILIAKPDVYDTVYPKIKKVVELYENESK